MKETALVIMAAGIGSRFGAGIKQLELVGPSGEIIMDYSIHDALEAGFNEIVFIIRKDLEQDFKEIIGNRIEQLAPVTYVYQELDNLPDGYSKPANRKKPWGTGQAVLACKDVVKDPFVVINADDYYGKEAFVKIHDFLVREVEEKDCYDFCMAGFMLENTLSENGTVTRGICSADENNQLKTVKETFEIRRNTDGKVYGIDKKGNDFEIPVGTRVSMNMWGLTLEIFEELEIRFSKFLSNLKSEDIKSEYLLPEIIDCLVQEKKAGVTILETNDKWFGVTYLEDKPSVVEGINKLIEQGVYGKNLYNNL